MITLHVVPSCMDCSEEFFDMFDCSLVSLFVRENRKFSLGFNHDKDIKSVEDMLRFFGCSDTFIESFDGRDPAKLPSYIYTHFLIRPVYIFDHGNIALSTTPYGDPWDSAWAGYIYVEKSTIRNAYGWKHISPKRAMVIDEIMCNELKSYASCVNGEVYDILLEDESTGESTLLETCYGCSYTQDRAEELSKEHGATIVYF